MTDTTQPALSALWEARYRNDPTDGSIPFNDTLAILLEHRSIRSYLPKPVPDGVLGAALAAAQSASTSSNLQPWSVIAVTDTQRKARLAAWSGKQKHVEQAPLFLAWVLDWSRVRRLGEARNAPTEGIDYLESFVVGAVDTALAAQNAAVAFESLGLGIVYIGGMRNRPEEVAKDLGLPKDSMVLFGMCVGYPDPDHVPAVKPRLPQHAVLHRERYDSEGEVDALQAYDQRVLAHERERGDDGRAWSQAVVDRVRGSESLMGRDRLREALSTMAFKLL